MKVTTHFLGDLEVGIFSYSYEAEISEPENDIYREKIRKYTKEFYETLMGKRSAWTIFEDEEFNDEGKLERRRKKVNLTQEQAEILLANIRLHDGIRHTLYSNEIKETLELWKRMKWIKEK